MTPLLRQPEGSPRLLYNEALCSASIERLYGVLKFTWRCLSRHRVLQYDPGFAGRIINACAVLHNIRNVNNILYDDILDEFNPEHVFENVCNNIIPDNNVNGALAIARGIKDQLIAERFGR